MYKVEIRRNNKTAWKVVEMHKHLEDAEQAAKDYMYLYEVRITK
jgi:hypothetical protein